MPTLFQIQPGDARLHVQTLSRPVRSKAALLLLSGLNSITQITPGGQPMTFSIGIPKMPSSSDEKAAFRPSMAQKRRAQTAMHACQSG
jgi:hypothetical protein